MSCVNSSFKHTKIEDTRPINGARIPMSVRISLLSYRAAYCLYLLSMPFYTSTMITSIVGFIIWQDMALVDLADLYMRIVCLCINSIGAFSSFSRESLVFRILVSIVNSLSLPLALYRGYLGVEVCHNPSVVLPVDKLFGCPLLVVLPILLTFLLLTSWIFTISLAKHLHGCQDYPCLNLAKEAYGTFRPAPEAATLNGSFSSPPIDVNASQIHKRKVWMSVMSFVTMLQISSIPAYLLVRTQQGFIPGGIEANVVGVIVDIFYATYLLIWSVYGIIVSTQHDHAHRLKLAWKLGIAFNIFGLLHLVATIMTSPPMPFSYSTYYVTGILILNILFQQLWITISALISRKTYLVKTPEP